MNKKVKPKIMSVLENDKKRYNAAHKSLKAGKTFTEETSYGTRKAEELMVSAFVNRWLANENDDRWLNPETNNKGADCIVHRGVDPIEGVNKVEIKTLKVKNQKDGGPFEFGHHFLPKGTNHPSGLLNSNESAFKDHMMVVCAYLKDACIRTIYIAHGPDVMNKLAELLAEEIKRPGFKPDREKKKDNPRLLQEKLDKLAEDYPFSKVTNENWAKKINTNTEGYLAVISNLPEDSQDSTSTETRK